MSKSEAKKKIQSLVDKIDREHGALAHLSIVSDKGTVEFVIINTISGNNITAAKKDIRAWAKKNKIKLRWV